LGLLFFLGGVKMSKQGCPLQAECPDGRRCNGPIRHHHFIISPNGKSVEIRPYCKSNRTYHRREVIQKLLSQGWKLSVLPNRIVNPDEIMADGTQKATEMLAKEGKEESSESDNVLQSSNSSMQKQERTRYKKSQTSQQDDNDARVNLLLPDESTPTSLGGR
jgi:hypothetical protein